MTPNEVFDDFDYMLGLYKGQKKYNSKVNESFDLKPGELILSLEHNVYNTKIAGFQYVARRLKENITKINIVDLINNPLYHFSLIFDKLIISFLIGLILTINNLIKLILIKQMLRKILKYFLAIAECPVIHASEIY